MVAVGVGENPRGDGDLPLIYVKLAERFVQHIDGCLVVTAVHDNESTVLQAEYQA